MRVALDAAVDKPLHVAGRIWLHDNLRTILRVAALRIDSSQWPLHQVISAMALDRMIDEFSEYAVTQFFL